MPDLLLDARAGGEIQLTPHDDASGAGSKLAL
jgi:hypothetical protein